MRVQKNIETATNNDCQCGVIAVGNLLHTAKKCLRCYYQTYEVNEDGIQYFANQEAFKFSYELTYNIVQRL